MKVLLVGSGGREHALAWKLSAADELTELHAAPGNPGIAQLGACHPVRAEDGEGLLALARALDTDLVVIGPEAPLVGGVADELRHAGMAVFGPSAAAARIEGSKHCAKEVMSAAGVPTAEPLAVARPPCVLKADGLAAGKGVFVCRSQAELEDGLREVAAFGEAVVIEELLEGEEVSVFALCDGARAIPLPTAQDFKRVGDGDSGPNTGGMGAYSPAPVMTPDITQRTMDEIIKPTVHAMKEMGAPFRGVLFAGLMITQQGPKLIEYNVRFGDPECQVLMLRLMSDLVPALIASRDGQLKNFDLRWYDDAALVVVMATKGYPGSYGKGSVIRGLDAAGAL